jgi:hypothetical protein
MPRPSHSFPIGAELLEPAVHLKQKASDEKENATTGEGGPLAFRDIEEKRSPHHEDEERQHKPD